MNADEPWTDAPTAAPTDALTAAPAEPTLKRGRDDDDEPEGAPPAKRACSTEAPASGPRILARAWQPSSNMEEQPVLVWVADGALNLVEVDEERKPVRPPLHYALDGLRRTVLLPNYLRLHFATHTLALVCTEHEVDILPRHTAEFAAFGAAEVERLSAERPAPAGASAAQIERLAASIQRDARQAEQAHMQARLADLARLQLLCVRKLVMDAAPATATHPTVADDAATFTAVYNNYPLNFTIADEPATLVVDMGPSGPVFYASLLVRLPDQPSLRGVIVAAPNLDQGEDSEDERDVDDAVSIFLLPVDLSAPLVLSKMPPTDGDILCAELDRRFGTPTVIACVSEAAVAACDLSVLVNVADAVETFGLAYDSARPDHLVLSTLKIFDGDAADAALEEAAVDSGNESVFGQGEAEDDDDDDDYSSASEINSAEMAEELAEL